VDFRSSSLEYECSVVSEGPICGTVVKWRILFPSKTSLCLIKHHAMKTYAESGGIAPRNLNSMCHSVVKLSLCLIKHHAMKTYAGSGGIAPRDLNSGTRWEWQASRPGRFTSQLPQCEVVLFKMQTNSWLKKEDRFSKKYSV
jgi:hypothetical protein